MAFEDSIQEIADSISGLQNRGGLQTEEATKQALILPLIEALGYNVRDTAEVQPESTADFGTRKGGKVDYAILLEGNPIVIIECKQASDDLSSPDCLNQLLTYFSATAAKTGYAKGLIGVLSNGIFYKFYTDNPEHLNVMDKNPFWEVDLLALDDDSLKQLGKFAKGFNVGQAVKEASKLRFISEMKKSFAQQYDHPSGDFLKFFASPLHSGNFTEIARGNFHPLVKEAFEQFVKEQMFRAAESIINRPAAPSAEVPASHTPDAEPEVERTLADTVEEVEAYHIVRAMLGGVVDIERVQIKDTIEYCAVNLDNTRHPLCRFYFNSKQKQIVLFDGSTYDSGAKKETRFPIDALQDIHNHADQIRETARRYLEPSTE